MADFPINDSEINLALRMFEETDRGHADVFNAVAEILINNDAFLNVMVNKMIEKSKISHVLDSASEDEVLGADTGPKITQMIQEVDQKSEQTKEDLGNYKMEFHWDDAGNDTVLRFGDLPVATIAQSFNSRDLGDIKYFIFNNQNYSDATIDSMIQHYYSQLPSYTVCIVRLIPNGSETVAIVQRTSDTHGSYIRYGYITGYAFWRLDSGIWIQSMSSNDLENGKFHVISKTISEELKENDPILKVGLPDLRGKSGSYIISIVGGFDGTIVGNISGSGNYGSQILVSDTRFKYRYLSEGQYTEWVDVAFASNLVNFRSYQIETSQTSIETILNEWYKTVPDNINFILRLQSNGRVFLIEGYRANDRYGYMRKSTYDGGTPTAERKLYNGIWGGWNGFTTVSDFETGAVKNFAGNKVALNWNDGKLIVIVNGQWAGDFAPDVYP